MRRRDRSLTNSFTVSLDVTIKRDENTPRHHDADGHAVRARLCVYVARDESDYALRSITNVACYCFLLLTMNITLECTGKAVPRESEKVIDTGPNGRTQK